MMSSIRASPMRWHGCRTFSAIMSSSACWRWCSGLPSACRSRCSACGVRRCARRRLASPASCRRSPASRCLRCSIRCCSALAAFTERVFGFSFSALGLLPSVLALMLYSMLPVLRNTITGLERGRSRHQGSRGRRRHDAAAIADDGRMAARAADHHGRHSHRGGVGDRRSDALDADRPDQPRQLHFHRAADPELGVRPVRLRGGGGARDRRRSVAGADRDRRRASGGAAFSLPASSGSLAVASLSLLAGAARNANVLRHRRQAVRGTIHPRRADRAAARGQRPCRRAPRRTRFGGCVRRARRRRHRHLCRIYRARSGPTR